MKGLYAITDCDRVSAGSLVSATEQVLRAGVVALQYRNKSGSHARKKSEAGELRQLCKEYNSLFIINDDLQLAVSTGSDGVHLGREDYDCKTARNELGPEAIIGISCYNSVDTALAAQEDGADYVAFGSFFPSSSKQNTTAAELDIIRQAKARVSLPVAAIGGITPANCRTLIEHGADMLAVISSIYQAEDPYATVKEFNRVIFSHRGHREHNAVR